MQPHLLDLMRKLNTALPTLPDTLLQQLSQKYIHPTETCSWERLRKEVQKCILATDYTFLCQMGKEGKGAICYQVQHKQTQSIYIIKHMKRVSPEDFENEVRCQKIAAACGVAPRIHASYIELEAIIMEPLKYTLLDYLQYHHRTTLSNELYHALTDVLRVLDDEARVFHADPNPLNFMSDGYQWYLIDYGFAQCITPEVIREHGVTPNQTYMIRGLNIYLESFLSQSKKKEMGSSSTK